MESHNTGYFKQRETNIHFKIKKPIVNPTINWSLIY